MFLYSMGVFYVGKSHHNSSTASVVVATIHMINKRRENENNYEAGEISPEGKIMTLTLLLIDLSIATNKSFATQALPHIPIQEKLPTMQGNQRVNLNNLMSSQKEL